MSIVPATVSLAALLAVSFAAVWDAPPEPPGIDVFHMTSDIEGTAFREVFVVTGVYNAGYNGFSSRHVDIHVDGNPVVVSWADPDGLVSVNDTFSFVQEAFDQKQILSVHWAGQEIGSCRFGGGAALGLHPDEWLELGMPEQIRCLQLTDDQ